MKKSKATEALRVASDFAAIKAALHQRGYRLRKQAETAQSGKSSSPLTTSTS
jgi:lambda repressor-like predicted transcriptional regulator